VECSVRLIDAQKHLLQRRLTFGLLVIVSQVMLIALAISWLIHMAAIAVSGSVYFVENNPYILWIEMAISILIIVFAIYIFVIQIQKLGERRTKDRRS
jgi:hypothetical protein